MLVSTTANNVDFESNGWQTDEDFLSKPRGFFADQFEVRLARHSFDLVQRLMVLDV
jgi:cysteine synthase A